MDPLTITLISHATQRSLALWLANLEAMRMLAALTHLRRVHGHGPSIHPARRQAMIGGGP